MRSRPSRAPKCPCSSGSSSSGSSPPRLSREPLWRALNLARGRYQRDLFPSLDAIEAELRTHAEPGAAAARPEQFVDLSAVERIRASGYVDALWQ